jgi:hypothetical protein
MGPLTWGQQLSLGGTSHPRAYIAVHAVCLLVLLLRVYLLSIEGHSHLDFKVLHGQAGVLCSFNLTRRMA